MAQFDSSPKLGTDWNLGDDVGYDIAITVPAFAPDGLTGVARVGGWERTLTGTRFISPVLELPGDLDE